MKMCMPASVCWLLYCTTALFKVLHCKIKNVFFVVCDFFLYVHIICVKSIISLLQYYIANCVSWVPRLTLLHLWRNQTQWTCSWNGTHSHVGDLLRKEMSLFFSHSVVSDSLTPWARHHQAPLSVGLPEQEHWSRMALPSPAELLDPGNELASAVLAGGFFTTEPPRKPI